MTADFISIPGPVRLLLTTNAVYGTTALYLYRLGLITPVMGNRASIALVCTMHVYGQIVTGGSASFFAAWMSPYIQVCALRSFVFPSTHPWPALCMMFMETKTFFNQGSEGHSSTQHIMTNMSQ
jgi:hypothetical protein